MKTCVILALVLAAIPVAAQPPSPCGQPEADQFDFWVGTWDVEAKGAVVGHNVIAKIHGGCTLLEKYHTSRGAYEGSSFNWYDPGEGLWHQVWVDNGGTRLDLSGGLVDGAMVMSGTRLAQGKTLMDRITWTPNDDGTVRQFWENSTDDGETWTMAFDGLYRPAAAGEGSGP